jgi:hypothetical protein
MMGASGVKPMQNDTANDWVAANVAQPLCAAIEKALRGFLAGSDPPVTEEEAEVAAALLVDCTSSKTITTYKTINLRKQAALLELWDLAIAAVDRILGSDWPGKWRDPEAKRAVLAELRQDLTTAYDESASIREYFKEIGRL